MAGGATAPLLTGILDWLLPAVCCVCGRDSGRGCSLCPACEADLPWIRQPCYRCATGCPRPWSPASLCGQCLLSPPAFDRCHSLFSYRSPVRELLLQWKYQGRLETGAVLAELLAERMEACYQSAPRPQLLLPVPLHDRRLRQRGFNQAIELARVLSRRCRIPLATEAVYRTRNTPSQSGLASVRQRRLNLRGAFAVRPAVFPENVTHVTIIDDVVTSSATVSELSRLLRGRGVREVEVCCLARATLTG